MERPNPLTSIALSRKGILTLGALAACTALAIAGRIEMHQFVTTLTVLVGVLIAGIAIEDHGAKSAPTSIATTGDVNVRSEAPPPMPPPPRVPS